MGSEVSREDELQLSWEPPPGKALAYVVYSEKDQESTRTLQDCGAVAGRRTAEATLRARRGRRRP